MLMSDVDNVGGYAYVGAVGVWKISVSFSLFCWKPKIALKILLKNWVKHEEDNSFVTPKIHFGVFFFVSLLSILFFKSLFKFSITILHSNE